MAVIRRLLPHLTLEQLQELGSLTREAFNARRERGEVCPCPACVFEESIEQIAKRLPGKMPKPKKGVTVTIVQIT